MEPVSSSLAGACLSPVLTFRSANRLKTRIATAPIPSRELRLGVSQGTTKRFRIWESTPNPEKARLAFSLDGKGNLTALHLINS
jgi:hypothetical protein